MLASLTRYARYAIEIALPQRCAACGAFGANICSACHAHFTSLPLCVRFDRPTPLAVTALGLHAGALRTAVLAIKFRCHRRAAVVLGEIVARRLEVVADYLIPVPLYPGRRRQRGFNQAYEIAKGIANVHNIPIATDAIVRCRSTAAQSGLALHERKRNVINAFAPGPFAALVSGKHVALVDDVMTTGATLQACAATLDAAGVAQVTAVVLACRL